MPVCFFSLGGGGINNPFLDEGRTEKWSTGVGRHTAHGYRPALCLSPSLFSLCLQPLSWQPSDRCTPLLSAVAPFMSHGWAPFTSAVAQLCVMIQEMEEMFNAARHFPGHAVVRLTIV